MSVLNAPHFANEADAYAWVEARVWPDGPICPHCGGFDRIKKLNGKSTRIGVHKCYACRKPFTVKVGTVFEVEPRQMHIWLQAMYLLCASKKGMSSNQLHRTLGVTLKTAWFMSHRIREAMRSGELAPMGGRGGIVEADETYLWKPRTFRASARPSATLRPPRAASRPGRQARDHLLGRARRLGPFVPRRESRTSRPSTRSSAATSPARLACIPTKAGSTATWPACPPSTRRVKHSAGEYVRGDVHTNSVEGFFSIFKRGMRGVYQHCGEKHLHRYLAEFDFRYNHRVRLGVDDQSAPSARSWASSASGLPIEQLISEGRHGSKAQSWPHLRARAATNR